MSLLKALFERGVAFVICLMYALHQESSEQDFTRPLIDLVIHL